MTKPNYTVEEVARILNVTVPTIRQYCIDGRLAATSDRMGKQWTINDEDLQLFLADCDKDGVTQASAKDCIKILIVDDDPSVVSILCRIFSCYQHVCIDRTNNSYTAYGKIWADEPKLVLLDAELPGMDGRQLLDELRRNENTRQIKILAISGYPDALTRMIELGADDCLAKPFTPEQVLEKVQNLLPNLLQPNNKSLQ